MFELGEKLAGDSRAHVLRVLNEAYLGGDEVVSSDSARVLSGIFTDMQATDAGAIVNSATSMRVSAVYRCTALICGSVASQPVDIYKRDDKAKSFKVPLHPLWWPLNESANASFSAATFKEFLTAQMLLRGDGLAYIIRDRDLSPIGFLPLRREQVVIQQRVPKSPKDPPTLVYFVTTPWGSFAAEYDEMIHFPGFGFNGVESLSVIQWGARNAIGTAMRADEFAGKFFSQGAQPQFALTTDKKMSDEQKTSLRESWASKYQGNGPNGIPLVLTEGLDVKELSMTAADAQLIETRKWQVSDIARAFGVPPHMIGDTEKSTSWGTGLEELGQAFVDYTLAPHIKRLEDELNRKLFKRGPNYVRVNLDGLMRGNATARATYYKSALGGTQNAAWMTPNEVRDVENLPPSDDPEADKLAKPKPAPPNQGNSNADQSNPGT
jgi:HK97 family phage portal protein